MSTTYNATHTVADFKAKFNTGKINLKRAASGKHYAIADSGMELKVSEPAVLALSDPATAADIRISECSDESKSFFMIHMKASDGNAETIFSI